MAGIQKRVSKKGVVKWQTSVRIPGHDEVFATLPTLEAALQFGKDAERKIKKEREALRDPSSWLPEGGDLNDERLLTTIEHFKKQLHAASWYQPTFPALLRVVGDPTIGQIKPSWIKKYIKRARRTMTVRGTPYSWASISHQLCLVSKVLKWRADQLDVEPTPFVVRESYYVEAAQDEGKRKEALNNERDRRFEPGEEAALMRRLGAIEGPQKDHWPLLVKLAIETGARLQELILAEWKEFDATGEWWHIPWEHSKTKDRSMILTDGAIDALSELRRLADPTSPRLFHPMKNPGAVSEGFRKHRAHAGLADFRFHDLRHEGISRFVLAQPDFAIKAIMTMVGHSSIEMLNRYAKLRPNELSKLIRRRPPIV
jgi:integrase